MNIKTFLILSVLAFSLPLATAFLIKGFSPEEVEPAWLEEAAAYYHGEKKADPAWMAKVDKHFYGKKPSKVYVEDHSVWGNPDEFAQLKEASKSIHAHWGIGEQNLKEIEAEAERLERELSIIQASIDELERRLEK